MVDVSRVNTHAMALCPASHPRVLREAALAVVAEKLIDLVAIVGDVKVHIAVVVGIKNSAPMLMPVSTVPDGR